MFRIGVTSYYVELEVLFVELGAFSLLFEFVFFNNICVFYSINEKLDFVEDQSGLHLDLHCFFPLQIQYSYH